MDRDLLATLLSEGRHGEAAELIERYTVPQVTSLTEDRIGHDLSPEGLDFLTGSFVPCGSRVMIDVDSAYSFLGQARAALLLYVGQPGIPGTRLYDSGGSPLPGVRWFSVASLSGESVWAQTSHRRLVLDVDPDRPVTWQILGAIIGGASTVTVSGAHRIAITPDGTKAFVTSPSAGTVTPIVLGRPGYSIGQRPGPDDLEQPAIVTGGTPEQIAADDRHVLVAAGDHIAVLSVAGLEVVRRIQVPAGAARGCAITPDGRHAVVGTSAGVLWITLETGEVTAAEVPGGVEGVAILPDGTAAFAADPQGQMVHRVALPSLEVVRSIPVGAPPHVVRIAEDGQVWVLCRPAAPEAGRLVGIDPDTGVVATDSTLPFPLPSDLAIVPATGQSSEIVRTAWTVFDGDRYCQVNIGGAFTGQPHSIHHGQIGEDDHAGGGIAVNDYGEIWLTQPGLDRVWKWPGGRLYCRAGTDRPGSGVFFGEYCDVAIYGARSQST